MLATILSRAQSGMEAPLVCVEVHLGAGLPMLSIVGLPEAVVKESKDRVRSALANANFEFPAGRITVNLAPADLPKEGGRFDLPIALGVLVASEQIPAGALADCEFYGELSLSGELRPVRGVLPAICQAARQSHRIVLPRANLEEASLVREACVAPAEHLLEVCAHVAGKVPLIFAAAAERDLADSRLAYPDLLDVRGQAHAKRALEIAAAGGHSLLLSGPPGAGKSMLAHRLPGILPPMTEREALETATVASISSAGFRVRDWGRRPFRAPHHTASTLALVGGGAHPRPGEISLAHNGVLFLDELPEFTHRVLEALREPLETGTITISRALRQAEFPAQFQLIAAMNPCRCGYLGDRDGRCRCSVSQVQQYRARISGPLLDRIDLHVEVSRPHATQFRAAAVADDSAVVAARVVLARAAQRARGEAINSRLQVHELATHCGLRRDAENLLERAMSRLNLSARARHRILKVARTIADLDASDSIREHHLAEAIQLRRAEPLEA
ncbi:MAG TPA: YifB family Mg chelatase-like AAA ATPase [Steroidobacteraceae bacterium]|nr:YifB family Mg chelatase-like AAA ATPase [Steroidobacteraceae bacterium]